MADNVLYTQGTGTNIATDDVGSVHFQKVKLDVGGDGVSLQPAGSLPVYIVSGVGAYAMNDPFVDAIAIAGQMDDTATTLATENNIAPVRITPQRALHIYIDSGIALDSDGAIYMHPYSSNIWHYSQEFTVQQTDYVIKSGIANLSLYLNTIYLAANAAVNVTLEEGTNVQKWKYYAGGQGDGVALQLNPPIKLATNTNLTFTTSTGVTVFLTVTGFSAT